MPIRFTCPWCQASLTGKSELEGKHLRCPKCKQAVRVPPCVEEGIDGEATISPDSARTGTEQEALEALAAIVVGDETQAEPKVRKAIGQSVAASTELRPNYAAVTLGASAIGLVVGSIGGYLAASASYPVRQVASLKTEVQAPDKSLVGERREPERREKVAVEEDELMQQIRKFTDQWVATEFLLENELTLRNINENLLRATFLTMKQMQPNFYFKITHDVVRPPARELTEERRHRSEVASPAVRRLILSGKDKSAPLSSLYVLHGLCVVGFTPRGLARETLSVHKRGKEVLPLVGDFIPDESNISLADAYVSFFGSP